MSDVTRILSVIEQGNPHAARQLLPLVYDELRKLAAEKMAQEKPGQTLQATALVHEAYLRLVDADKVQHWNSRGHFFAAAAEAMRRILIESARGKARGKHGGDWQRVDFEQLDVGGLFSAGATSITSSGFSANSATWGGAMWLTGPTTVSGSTLITGNSAGFAGGGIVNVGTLTVTGSSIGRTLSGNSAPQGGGIYNAGALTVGDSNLSGSSATYGGESITSTER